ncbi:metallophosphoesterase family protein [Nocardia goodfellowii]|uniref:Icc-related predicted phosphoesterase n=1 Tax=Nocardia goodfellowii TaxID=882446 RepID=A0ABS4QHP6_9NOCA|nr:metallophosphoesterase [Nocardia goodfellowii]MBP2190628.1 Icc-related predicted phosphoesterase [Nocardia goodfellowii]
MTVRVAAVADLHMRPAVAGKFRPEFLRLAEHADILLLAGDLTEGGRIAEAELLRAELAGVPVPMVAVLGNHDHDRKQGYRIAAMLGALGVRMLEGESTVLEVAGVRVGIAGVMGGSGGFPGHPGDPENANPEHRERMRRGPLDAELLRQTLETLDTDIRIALMHYSPVVDTLVGEPIRIYPGLGCHELATAIDRGAADLAVHGHAHAGTESGQTPGGVPVRNVSYPVLRRPYAVYIVEPTETVPPPAGAAL